MIKYMRMRGNARKNNTTEPVESFIRFRSNLNRTEIYYAKWEKRFKCLMFTEIIFVDVKLPPDK